MPALDTFLVERHVLHPGGDVELVVRVCGPLPDGAVAVLVDLGGSPDGDDVLVERTWPPAMAPTAPRSAMRQYLTAALTAWAAAADGPIAVSDPDETL